MESVDSHKLVSILHRIDTIPPYDENKCSKFVVSVCKTDTTVYASSSFEAALKIGFVLLELKLLKDRSLQKVKVCESTTGNLYVYNIREKNDNNNIIPLVILENVEIMDAVSVYSQTFDANENDNEVIQSGTESVNSTGVLITDTLKRYFGHNEFRALQKETIISTMRGESVLTVLSTGGGKSLTYMLPAVLASKPTLVISPTKSLIVDQLSRCNELGISACQFTGDVPENIQITQLEELQHFKLIFSTPEVLERGAFHDKIHVLMSNDCIERVVFDEAHTISSWGDTFRPVYKTVCEELAQVPCVKLLLSATVHCKVQCQLMTMFGDLTVYRNSVFRENLFLEVLERGSKLYDALATYIKDKKGQCGIVYAVLPRDVSKIHSELIKRGIDAVKYHGQLSEEMKTVNLTKWMNGQVQLMVANSSFGLGIDRPDVRYVIHARVPTSLDEYYQQCGRAGRDGLPAFCVLYYSYSDKTVLYKLFGQCEQSQCLALNDLIVFLEDPVQCRHKAIMAYYGERRDNFVCLLGCNNCKNRGMFHITDGSTDAFKVVQSVVELADKEISCNTLKLFLVKSSQKVIREKGLDSLDNYGVLEKKFVPPILLDKFLHLLIVNDILAEKVQKKGKSLYFNITLGQRAHDLLAMNVSVIKYEKVK